MMLEAGAPPLKIRLFIGDDISVLVQTLTAILNVAGYDACAIYGGDASVRVLNLLKPQLIVIDLAVSGPGNAHMPFSSALRLSRCKAFLFSSPSDLHSLLCNGEGTQLPLELLTWPIDADDLSAKLMRNLCSEQPPLLVPIDMSEAATH